MVGVGPGGWGDGEACGYGGVGGGVSGGAGVWGVCGRGPAGSRCVRGNRLTHLSPP